MTIAKVGGGHAAAAVALLGELRVSLFGVQSKRLHEALIQDGLDGTIDCRVATEDERLAGIVLAAPASYWRRALLRHWVLGVECLVARLESRRRSARLQPNEVRPDERPAKAARYEDVRTWANPGDAWRILFVGTAAAARGQGVASALYRSVMADHSLVARIALDNDASLHLHRSLGWQLRLDGDVMLAVWSLSGSGGRMRPNTVQPADEVLAPVEQGARFVAQCRQHPVA